MTEILALLQSIAPLLEKKTFRQMSQVIFGMLVITGRVSMLGLSRWTDKGGSYRTIQRFYHSMLPWANLLWTFFVQLIWQPEDEYILAGDEVIVSKAGKETYGLDRFFSSTQQRPIAGLSFFTFSLINVREEQSYPVQATQMVKSPEEKAASQAKAQQKKARKTVEKKKPGRPKGRKNKNKQEVVLSAELVRVQKVLRAILETVCAVLSLKYVVLDGHFGNYPSAWMVRQENLHLISKMRSDAALYPPFEGEYSGSGRPAKYGEKIKVRQMEANYLKETSIEDKMRTEIYQGQFYNKEFSFALNVVVILKTNLETGSQAQVILFSTDLELAYDQMIKLYSLRFQIEFNFREAKQYWGLEDFMNVKEIAVTNAANLSFFMVNFSSVLLHRFRQIHPEFSILDLKAHYHGCRYVTETIKWLPQKPDGILLAEIFEQIARLGMVHPVFEPASTS
jgi:DDE superfamily endonuclease